MTSDARILIALVDTLDHVTHKLVSRAKQTKERFVFWAAYGERQFKASFQLRHRKYIERLRVDRRRHQHRNQGVSGKHRSGRLWNRTSTPERFP